MHPSVLLQDVDDVDQNEEDEDSVIVADTARASRAARSPPPSDMAQQAAWETTTELAGRLEDDCGLVRVARQPAVNVSSKSGRSGSRETQVSNSMARPAAQLSHVFSLQRPIDANARESSFLVYQTTLPLEATQLAAAGMRSNSVRASVVHKAKKTQGGGQQTTRNSLQDICASFAAQSTAVAVAMGVARRVFGRASDPGATMATSLAQFVDGVTPQKTGLFITTSSTRLLPHALPIRVCAHNLLTTMREFAAREIEVGVIRSLVPQQVTSLNSICVKICDKTDGVNVWAAWVLLIHMLSDPRLRKLVRASPITDHEVAVAYLFTNYARAEVTRRARMDQTIQKRGKGQATPETSAMSAMSATVAYVSDAELQADAQTRHESQTLSLKRKRPPCSGVVQVSGGVLDYWSAALSSEYASILKLMITQSRSLANQASVETLTGQAPPGFNSVRNALLVDISARNAFKSAEALSALVVTTPERVPKIVTWRCRNAENRLQTHTGLVRSSSDASNTTVHAIRMPAAHLQEPSGHTKVFWSLAIRNATPHDASTSLVPGIVEGVSHLHAVSTGQLPMRHRYYATRVMEAITHRTQRAACDGSLDVTLTGIARGFIVVRAKLVVGESQVRSGKAMAESLKLAHNTAREATRGAAFSDFDSVAVTSEASLSIDAEPFATPSNNLALALEANEQLRVLFKSKSHRGDPCRHLTGVVTPSEMGESSCEEHDRPQTLLPIVDCKIEMLDDPEVPVTPLPNRRDAGLVTVAIQLTVCGDSPVRLPELLDLFAREKRDDAGKQIFEITSLICGGAARASELNDVSSSVSSGHVNSSIASAKRILVGDLNMRLFCTLFQVYRVGTSNVPRSFDTTPWSGCYGAGFDIGTSGGIGIRASSVTADKRCVYEPHKPTEYATRPLRRHILALRRNHGKILMAQSQVDEWCAASARSHYMQINDLQYAAVPREARGVPHMTIPGLHAYLDDYTDALERARTLIGAEDRRTVDSLQCLPLSPFAERQPPHISEGSGTSITLEPTHNTHGYSQIRTCADPTMPKRFRNPDDAVGSEGRAFQVDSTCADVAIMREPLIPCVAITSPQDCIFGQSQPFLTSVLGAAAALSRVARAAYIVAYPNDVDAPPEKEVHFIYVLLKAFYDGTVPPMGASHYWACTAAVLLNCIFTCGHEMAQNVIASGNALAPAACAKRMRQQEAAGQEPIGAPLRDLVDADASAEAMRWWAPFARTQESLNAWVKVCPLVVLLSKINGSLDLSTENLDEVWCAVHGLVCTGSWLHESPDGMLPPVEPSPLAGLRGASQVRAEHVTPTFVGKAGNFHDSRPATACIVGVLPMGFQQIAALLQGASKDESVVVNYAQNFSFLVYRPSAAPDIMTNKNKERSSKAISCVNVEGDEAAFGTRSDKIVVCKLHRVAWRTNLDLVKPLCLRVSTPRTEKQRARGDREACDFCKSRKRQLEADHLLTHQEVVADALMEKAILGKLVPV
tara:strand:- start:1840 stop:6294 length:4455 start_codon:yes stop_codon:yes gene_type:complete